MDRLPLLQFHFCMQLSRKLVRSSGVSFLNWNMSRSVLNNWIVAHICGVVIWNEIFIMLLFALTHSVKCVLFCAWYSWYTVVNVLVQIVVSLSAMLFFFLIIICSSIEQLGVVSLCQWMVVLLLIFRISSPSTISLFQNLSLLAQLSLRNLLLHQSSKVTVLLLFPSLLPRNVLLSPSIFLLISRIQSPTHQSIYLSNTHAPPLSPSPSRLVF